MSTLIGPNVTKVSSSAEFRQGQIHQDYDGKIYKYVKLLNESATVVGAAGDAVAYLGSPSATENNTVVTDNTDAATKPVGAGLLMATVVGATGTAEYVWVQISGPATVNTTLAGSPADGDALFLSTSDKALTLASAADDPVCAYAIDDSTDKIMCAFAH